MPTSFLDLTNALLRRLNEVEISQADFLNTRGVQSLAKDAVKSSISKINQMEFEWPFNASLHTQVLVAGQSEYGLPDDHKISDWDSFQIIQDNEVGSEYGDLEYISRNDWYVNSRDSDFSSGSKGRGVPHKVFPSHGLGYGVTPAPDKAYTLRFRYFLNYTSLVASTDTPRVPSAFDTTIVDGALYYMYMFKDNAESASATLQVFSEGVKALQSIYINHLDHISDRRVNFGGFSGGGVMGRFG